MVKISNNQTYNQVRVVVDSIPDNLKKIKSLSRLVAQRLGGHGTDIDKTTDEELARLKQLHRNVIPLGKLKKGVCRHRSILFKVAADYIGIPSRLVRGSLKDQGSLYL
jgi:serine/threonine-protein kinase CTR1